MSYTNQTTNYQLPLYVANDKPTYLGDFNTAMNTIDTQMKANADASATAISTAQGAVTTANTASATATQAQTDATTAQNTANSAQTDATTALTTANNIANELNLTTSTVTCTITNGSLASGNNSLTIAKNTSGSLAKIYGRLRSNGAYGTITSGDTGLRPTSAITFNGCALRVTPNYVPIYQSFTLNTNGTITTDMPNMGRVNTP